MAIRRGTIEIKPFWERDVVKEIVDAPAITPIGGAAVVSKTIVKHTGAKLLPIIGGTIAGAIAGSLLGGGQEQDAAQDVITQPKLDSRLEQMQRQQADFRASLQARLEGMISARQTQDAPQRAGTDIGGSSFENISGRINYAPVTTTYQEGAISSQGISQELLAGILQSQLQLQQATQVPSQIVTVTPSLEQTQERGNDWGIIALIVAAGVLLFGAFKK